MQINAENSNRMVNHFEEASIVQKVLVLIPEWMNDRRMQKYGKVLNYGKEKLSFPYMVRDESSNQQIANLRERS